MKTVLVPLAKGFEEIEAVSIIDILRRAQIEVVVASLDDNALVQGAHGIVIEADVQIKDVYCDILDMVVLPGGWDGTYALADDENVQRILHGMNESGKNIGAICAAPYVLDKAGVLKNKFTCYPTVEEQITHDGYIGPDEMVVHDTNIMTSRGPGTSMCFALEIVKKLKGEEEYEALRNGLLTTYCK